MIPRLKRSTINSADGAFPPIWFPKNLFFLRLKFSNIINKSSKSFMAWPADLRTAQHLEKGQLQCGFFALKGSQICENRRFLLQDGPGLALPQKTVYF